MEAATTEEQNAQNQLLGYAANMYVNEKKNAVEIKRALMEKGLSDNSAVQVVELLERKIKEAKKVRANKDMLYGALWCVGGSVATLANIGYIFWGAILFGGIQFVKGFINSMD